MDKNRFVELINLYLLEKATDHEGAELAAVLSDPGWREEFERIVQEQLQERLFDLDVPPQAVHARILAALDQEIKAAKPQPGRLVHFVRRPFVRYAAAIIVLLAGVYLYRSQKPPALLSQEQRFKNDLRPGTYGATLLLADGDRLALKDSLAATAALRNSRPGEAHITTGKGETYSLTLSDGTKVWLNASSSLTWPVSFKEDQRQVKLSGEAYFEVRHDSKRPFSVQLPDGSLVKDVGTHFNIHDYPDEPVIRTTVLEGAVQVQTARKALLLSPGDQAEYTVKKDDLSLQKAVNLPEIVAWKEEQFLLDATHIQGIMQQVERWYGAEVVYKENMQNDTTEFSGSLPMNVPVSQLLKLLELTGRVHFAIEGNKITVMK